MKVVVFYRPKSEHSTQVEEFIERYKQLKPPRKIEIKDVDSREGSASASIYDIVQYPAVMATTDYGEVIQAWQGQMLPTLSEVAYYGQS